MDLKITSGGSWPIELAAILDTIPEWFGIEAANRAYVEAARTLPNTVARLDDEIVGICLTRRHFPASAEIEFIAVRRDLHRQRIGCALLDHVEVALRDDGVRVVQVKTFGPSGDSIEYERTRQFYEAVGFIPLEETTALWGTENPCLILVKPL